jgi:hypothetical protein
VTGLLRPVVLLPSHRFGTLTGREQQMVLCHELAHLERADLWFGCVPALAERVFFFHPLAIPEISQADLKRHLRSIEESKSEIEKRMRDLEQRLKRDLDGLAQELQQRLSALEGPIRDMKVPMEEFGHRMEAFGQSMEKASRKANEEMRALIERAIASGLAQAVK